MSKPNIATARSAVAALPALAALGAVALLAAAGTGPAAAAAGGAQARAGAAGGAERVAILWLPPRVGPGALAAAGFAPGWMSAGLGAVPPAQTYLDVGQGNRVFSSLYGEPLPPGAPPLARPGSPGDERWWQAVRRRARSAPAEIEPGLLWRALARAGLRGRVVERGASPARAAALARLARRPAATRAGAPGLVIAIARPRGESSERVAIGIAGRGFDGNLTSDSTRMRGYVLSTDVAPTVLARLGVPVPGPMSGRPIRAEPPVDVAALQSLEARLSVISHRRGPVVGLSVLLWLAAAALATAASRGRVGPAVARLTALAVVYMPAVLLLGAALDPSEGVERLLVALLAPALGALTLAAAGALGRRGGASPPDPEAARRRGYAALGAACAVTVAAYAADVLAGSPLTALSLLGPNPGLGARFYGIGNELEALLAVLVPAGTGAALAGLAPRLAPRRAAAAFLATGLLAAAVFAPGRFGADVGAAIVLPLGAAVAAATLAGTRRAAPAIVAAPLAVLALLALADLLTGADAHLTRSVLDASGLDGLADVAQRRLELSARSFTRPVLLAFLPLVALAAALAWRGRRRIESRLAGAPALRAGMLGALAATVAGTLANDSGALLLEVGTGYLLAFLAFAWAQRPAARRRGDALPCGQCGSVSSRHTPGPTRGA